MFGSANVRPGEQREAITVLGYLFYLSVIGPKPIFLIWKIRGQPSVVSVAASKAMNSEAVVRLAEASQNSYGFKDFKLKGGILPGEQEIDTVRA